MPTIANLPAADLDVTFPSQETRTVNMIVLLVQTRNAEMKAKFGYFLPGVGKQHPTIAALREAYELDYLLGRPVRTWADAAKVMRHFYGLCKQHIAAR